MIPHDRSQSCFRLGRVLATPAALDVIAASGDSPAQFLRRHARGDWGCISREDAQANLQALDSGARLLSAYDTQLGDRVWVITEAADASGQRLATPILLPEEY